MAGHATRSQDSTPCHRFVPPGIGLHYSETAANAGCVLVSFGGAGRKLYPCVVPFGSREPFFSTNPFSIGAPGGGHSPAVLDFAASMVAGGKVAIAKANGLSLPEGCIVDEAGNPSTDPDDCIDGGALLPFGGVKGSAPFDTVGVLSCPPPRGGQGAALA